MVEKIVCFGGEKCTFLVEKRKHYPMRKVYIFGGEKGKISATKCVCQRLCKGSVKIKLKANDS